MMRGIDDLPQPAGETGTSYRMSNLNIVVSKLSDWAHLYPSEDLLSVETYLGENVSKGPTQVINLCRSYKYLSHGYYCSLLAEARGHRVIPSIRTLNDLSSKTLYALSLEDLNKDLDKELARHATATDRFSITLFFGETEIEPLREIARQLFEMFPCPILKVSFVKRVDWSVSSITAGSLPELTDEEETQFAQALDGFSRKIWRKPRARRAYYYDLAILVNPNEAMPPSNRRALKLFEKVARDLDMDVDFIEKKDFARLAEYDALFIRETTATNNHTYRFAKKAESEGMVVIDDPQSILRCTNKVYMADLLRTNNIPAPRSMILNRDNPGRLLDVERELGFPMVLKIPDGSFSRGVVKAANHEDLEQKAAEFFKHSALILAQEFCYTDYDWRIGILNGRPLFACQYFMRKGHWQIYEHSSTGKTSSGGFATFPVSKAPQHVVRNALKAANLIGNGLYGVDMKQQGDQSLVIEVNDNPNIDAGIEDDVLGEDLYRQVLDVFVQRLEQRRQRR